MPDSGAPAAAPIRPISRAEEKQIAKALSPDVAWPTLALAGILPAAFATVVALGLRQTLPLWVCALVLTPISYAHYSLVHESVHGNVVARKPGWTWVNTVVGWIGSVGLGVAWPALQRTHVRHHSHTNTDEDPDIFVKGSFGALLRKWVINTTISLIPLPLKRRLFSTGYDRVAHIFSRSDTRVMTWFDLAQLALLVAALATGHGLEWLCLWFAPTKFAILILNIFFQWLPHYPFDRTDRYGNTRISLWVGGRFLTLQQNLHLMHHLWPSVPFYNYGRLFKALRPVLVAEGSRIEGFGVGRWTRVKG